MYVSELLYKVYLCTLDYLSVCLSLSWLFSACLLANKRKHIKFLRRVPSIEKSQYFAFSILTNQGMSEAPLSNRKQF